MITVEKIKYLVDSKLTESTNFIVDVSIKPGNKIVVLLDNDKGVSIKDCVDMSRYIEFNLDRETEDFELSVSSPGLDRPFKTLRQYQKYIGKQIEITTVENIKLIGKLISVDNEEIELEETHKRGTKEKQLISNKIKVKFNQIKETKAVILF